MSKKDNFSDQLEDIQAVRTHLSRQLQGVENAMGGAGFMTAYAEVVHAYVRLCEVERGAIEDAGDPPKATSTSTPRNRSNAD